MHANSRHLLLSEFTAFSYRRTGSTCPRPAATRALRVGGELPVDETGLVWLAIGADS
jgi:hypothetical protein